MAQIRAVILTIAMAVSLIAVGQEPRKKLADQPANNKSAKNADLEKELWDADQQWLCSAGATPYHKDYKECVEFRSHYWTDQFFEVSTKGQVQTKAEMIASQRLAHPAPDVGPHPDDFQLMAVYGNFALATDHTNLKTMGPDGKLVGQDVRVLRMFVKENGTWRPAGAALVPIIQ
jgi:ketosteroid isomerase-like protein